LLSRSPRREIAGSSFGRGKSTGAYRRLARACHPDAAGGRREGASADEFMRVHAAYATLSEPNKRAEYDRQMVTSAAARRPPPFHYRPSSSASYYSPPAAASSSSSPSPRFPRGRGRPTSAGRLVPAHPWSSTASQDDEDTSEVGGGEPQRRKMTSAGPWWSIHRHRRSMVDLCLPSSLVHGGPSIDTAVAWSEGTVGGAFHTVTAKSSRAVGEHVAMASHVKLGGPSLFVHTYRVFTAAVG
ncbi:hypothetical protein Taro_043314, partial [Colocasia esculenta]|nr:hypothetical protein [Colocasia esculenta]